MRESTADQAQKLGQGRAAQVFLTRDHRGRAAVRKVFGGDAASKLVLYFLTGAGNAYSWCEAAIRTAFARRRILAHLVRFWFGDKLRLPRTHAWRWNPGHRAFELECELIHGSHAPLRRAGDDLDDDSRMDPIHELVREVMKPLQRRLESAGFDGLLWQAGRGNPVAASNFMLERRLGSAADDDRRWVWIDCESGVPALFALNPLATATFYLPKSVHHRGWLFDDVDVPRLRRYLWRNRRDLESTLGTGALGEMWRQVGELERWQGHWKSMPRHRRSISQELARGRISARRAEHYRYRPLRWQARMAAAALARCAARAPGLARRLVARLRSIRFSRLLSRGWRFSTSQRYRERLARAFVCARVRRWTQRGFLDPRQATCLRRQLRSDEASSYLTDFVVHLMIKAPVKAAQFLLVPPAVALGWLSVGSAAFLMVAGGFIGRTLYTFGRAVQALVRGQRLPWVALGSGLLPVVGNAAYPAQLLYGSTERTGDLARFIVHDTLAAAGRSVPIWGGADSLTEHFCNRLGSLAIRWLSPPAAPGKAPRTERRPVKAAA